MCNKYCIKFCKSNLKEKDIYNKKIIEVGSRNKNGSIRQYIESKKPKEYIGIDIFEGKGVDKICDASNIINVFPKNYFDILVSTELLEHVEDWQTVIHNFKMVVNSGGIIILTTRSKGMGYHPYPDDFWRYEEEDMKNIFSDFVINSIEKDKIGFGIFIKTTKPIIFKEKDILKYEIYSIK